MKFTSFACLFILLVSSCCSDVETTSTPSTEVLSDSIIYRNSVQDAMYPEESKVYDDLVAITKNNKELIWKTMDGEDYVLMVSWKGYIAGYEPYKDTGYYPTGDKYPIWVTAAPELWNRMHEEQYTDTNKRLLELLGLPPNGKYTSFVEFWVKPEDLFRPCPDNEITDQSCDVCFPSGADSAYIQWVNDTRIARYYPNPCGLYNQYPWTSLGYTYDWNQDNKTHVGLSEFVIRNNSKIKVERICSTSEYLNSDN